MFKYLRDAWEIERGLKQIEDIKDELTACKQKLVDGPYPEGYPYDVPDNPKMVNYRNKEVVTLRGEVREILKLVKKLEKKLKK